MPSSDLIGINISHIVPRPFAEFHNSYMYHFGTSGQGVMINTTRTMLALDGVKCLLPIIMRIHEIPPREDDSNAAPRFSATLKSPTTEENFIMFDNEKNKFRILHADSNSFSRLLGLTGEQVEDEDFLVGNYLPKLKVQTDDDSSTLGGHSRGNLLAASMHNLSSNDVANKLSADHQAFLNEMLSQSEHVTLETRNACEKTLDKILGKITKIPVRGYGYIYLLAWKSPVTKSKRTKKRTSVASEKPASLDFAPGRCPMSGKEDLMMYSSDQSLCSSSPPFSTAEEDNRDHTASLSESAHGVDPEDQGDLQKKTSLDEEFSWAKPRSNRGGGAGAESQGKSSAGTSSSAKRLLHHVTSNGITGVKPILGKTRIALTISVLLFIVYFAVGWSEVERITLGSIRFIESIRASNDELISYLAMLSSLLFAHIPNTPYSGMVNDNAAMWTSVEDRVSRYFASSDLSNEFVDLLGGITQSEELKRKFEVINRFTGDKEMLSTKETRDFVQAHLRQLLRQYNITDFVPGQTPHNAMVLFDNTGPLVNAINSSTLSRVSQLHEVTDSYVWNMEIIIFTMMCLTISSFTFVLTYYLLRLHRNNREILKTFLLLPLNEIKRQGLAATKSLKEHIQRASENELDLDGDSESENDSLVDFGAGEEEGEPEDSPINPQCPDDLLKTIGNFNAGAESASRPSQHQLSAYKTKMRRQSQLRDFRRHKDSKKFLIISVLRVLSPLAFLIAWTFSLFGAVQNTFSILEQETERLEFSELSIGEWIETQKQLALLTLRMPFPDTTLGNASTAQLWENRREALLNRNMAVQRMAFIINGQTDKMGTLPLGSIEREIWTGDVCSSLPKGLGPQCSETPLRLGLRPYIRSYLNDGLTIMSKLAPISEDNAVAMQQLADDEELQVEFRAFRNAIIPLAEEAARLFALQSIEKSKETVDVALRSIQVLTAVFVIVFAISIVLITVPAMERVGSALNSSFQLLFLIPEDLLQSHKKLRQQVCRVTENLAAEESGEDAMMLLASQNKEIDV